MEVHAMIRAAAHPVYASWSSNPIFIGVTRPVRTS